MDSKRRITPGDRNFDLPRELRSSMCQNVTLNGPKAQVRVMRIHT